MSYAGPRILLYTFLSKMFNYFVSLFVSVEVSDAYVNVLSIIVFFSINFSVMDNRMSHVVVCCCSDSAAQRGLWPPRTTRFRDHTQRRATVDMTPLDE
jgi:hypothetical protein